MPLRGTHSTVYYDDTPDDPRLVKARQMAARILAGRLAGTVPQILNSVLVAENRLPASIPAGVGTYFAYPPLAQWGVELDALVAAPIDPAGALHRSQPELLVQLARWLYMTLQDKSFSSARIEKARLRLHVASLVGVSFWMHSGGVIRWHGMQGPSNKLSEI